MIDRMLGGTGRGVAVNRALTEIEQNVVDAVVKLLLENLTETWRAHRRRRSSASAAARRGRRCCRWRRRTRSCCS